MDSLIKKIAKNHHNTIKIVHTIPGGVNVYIPGELLNRKYDESREDRDVCSSIFIKRLEIARMKLELSNIYPLLVWD
jgi:hypothetical protein